MTIGNTNFKLNIALGMLCLASSTLMQINHNMAAQPINAGMVNSSLVIEILKPVHQREHLKNIVFYISHHLLGRADMMAFRLVEDIWHEFASVPVILLINNTKAMKGFLSRLSLCLIITTQSNDPVLELAAVSLKGIRYLKTIFLLFPEEQLSEDFERFYQQIRLIYEWSWKEQFLNTLLITTRDQVYLYDPFPMPSILNKTDNWHLTEFLADTKLNVKGMEIRTPVRFDIPRVFFLRRFPNKMRTSRLTGTSGKLFNAFMKKINATFNETLMLNDEFQELSFRAIFNMIENKEMEISVQSFTNMNITGVGTSYPIEINDVCFMVPYHNSSVEHMLLARTFRPESVLLLCLAVLYISLGIWVCLPVKERDFTLSFLQAICCLILIAPLKVIRLPYARQRFLFVLLFIAAFCITHLYNAKMTSVLTTAGRQKQIETIQDILDAKLTIMMLDIEYKILKSMDFHKEFLKTVLPVNKPTLDKHREKLNTSYGYTVHTDRWDFINKQQGYLHTPIFRLTSICVGPYYHVFPLQKDSYLMKPLSDFIMDVSQAGFLLLWKKESFADALFLGYVQMFKVHHDVMPLTMTFFSSIWCLWIGGLCLGLLAFVVEVQAAKWKRWFKRKMKKLI